MPTNEERLAKAREIASSAQTRRIQLDTKLETNQLQQKALMRRFEKAGVRPDELNDKIKELDLEITKGLDDLESIYNNSTGNSSSRTVNTPISSTTDFSSSEERGRAIPYSDSDLPF
jgi:chromosome segregation ATPase